jgi:predicted metal-dependent hydrolase
MSRQRCLDLDKTISEAMMAHTIAAGHTDSGVEIVPRRFNGGFPDDIPRYWFRQNPILTNMLNTYTILVPDNEHYYMRNIRRTFESLKDSGLKMRVRKFIQQEGQHGVAHQRYWENLTAQGLKFRGFLKLTGLMSYRFLEALFPLSMQLSIIAAVEHINAYMGHIFLENDLLKEADPRKRLLFAWHFAEEIEHKEVAYDVFQEISGNYLLRIVGMLLTAPLFYLFNLVGTIYFSWQWGKLLSAKSWYDWLRFLFIREKVGFKSLYYLLLYFKPGFHPDQVADRHLAEAFLQSEAFREVSDATPRAEFEIAYF